MLTVECNSMTERYIKHLYLSQTELIHYHKISDVNTTLCYEFYEYSRNQDIDYIDLQYAVLPDITCPINFTPHLTL